MNRWVALFVPFCLGGGWLSPESARADEGHAFFEAQVRPLLVTHCYGCHGGDHAKGGLSLESRQSWQRGGDSGPVIVPGMPEESLLVRAIRHDAEASPMPPESQLAPEQIAVLVEWVRRGAPDPRDSATKIAGMNEQQAQAWWAFQPLADHQPPAGKSSGTEPDHPIDRFLLEPLEAAGLAPAVPADRRTWIRRATYDLTGLPPTPEEVESLVNDPSPDAFARVVDRLLDSPHYGERWGRHWLDVVRYADTAGENTDRPLPEMWRYRNWVFESLNRDLPMDEFTRMQLAGDLLRRDARGDAYAEGIIATGYLALARRFGHDIDQENHLMYEDVIDNLGKAFLGLTIACARCHDHKYDPVTQEDYYALYGILDSSRFSFSGCEAKGAPRDLVPLLTGADAEQWKRPWLAIREPFDRQISELEAQRPALVADWQSQAATKRVLLAADVEEAGGITFADVPGAMLDNIPVRKGETLILVVAPRGNHGADSTLVHLEIQEQGEGQRRWTTDDLVAAFPQANPHIGPADAPVGWHFLDLQAEPAGLNERLEGYENQPAIKIWRRGETPSVLVNTSDQPIRVWTELPARSFLLHPGPSGPVAVAWVSPIDGVVSIRGNARDVHPANGLDGVAVSLEHFADPQSSSRLGRLAEESSRRDQLIRKRDADSGPEPMIPAAFAVVDAEPQDASVHMQGDPEKKGATVPRRWLGIFGGAAVPADAGSGRLQLADWIATHPLSSRVIVNRVWQGHFGRGLVRSVNDFGSRGEGPSHPELLDWLTAQFEAGGRRLKPLHRLIMLSAAYGRSSIADNALVDADPDNRLWGRFARRRLSAEELRDSLLVVAGRLDRTPGHAHPFPPPATWGYTQHNPFAAVFDDNRRSVYQMVQRQRRHPFLALFDGADPNASTGQRQVTTVPTQSLYFFNDPFFHEQAAALADSLSDLPEPAARLDRLFHISLQRSPSEAERAWAADFLSSYPGDDRDRWAACCRLLLAGNEFLHLD